MRMVSRLLIVAITLIFNPACSTPPKDRDPLYSETVPNPVQDSGTNGVAVFAGACLGAASAGGHGGGGGRGGAIVAGATIVVVAAVLVADKIKKEHQDNRSSKAYPMSSQRSDPAIQSP